jgi:phospho-N-acetylmuramoyl-pentapeptide-transferase
MLYNLLLEYQAQLDEVGLWRFVRVFDQLEFRAFAAVVLSFLLVLLFGRRTIRWLLRQKIGDSPEFYHAGLNELMKQKASTPTMGGVLIGGSILATILLLADLQSRYIHLALIVLVWLAGVGGFDDWLKLTASRRSPGAREGLYAWEKLLFQLGVGFIVGFFLYRHGIEPAGQVLTLPFQRTYAPGTFELERGVVVLGAAAFIGLAMLLVAAMSNAVNLTDGMDGLAGGTLAIASFAMMVLCYVAGKDTAAMTLMFPFVDGTKELMVVSGAMAGACLGFLWFNCSPAMVFMGDTGSLPLGGLLAYLAVAIRQEVLLLIIGGVFFMEMASVIAQVLFFRATGGRRIFRCAPIHHHFHLGGWSEPQTVTRFWLLGIVLAMVAMVSLKLR